uniref:PTS sugar transporter subunit IIA n=1 Tax=candidate division WOR-3 bacterium TaxID=2052148 RepID=A0A7C4CC74_UNCW3
MDELALAVVPELAFDITGDVSQRELFELIAARLCVNRPTVCQTAVVECFEKREGICSTGVGHGVALPHAATAVVDDIFVVVVRIARPLEWRARDGAPVRLAVAIVSSPRLYARYLKVLAALARALHEPEVRERALAAATPAAAARVIAAAIRNRAEEPVG